MGGTEVNHKTFSQDSQFLKLGPPEYEVTHLTAMFWYYRREMGVKGTSRAG
jgi:hypothetical protein